MHANGDAEHGAHGDEVSADMAIADGAVVSAPIHHHFIGGLEGRALFSVAAGSKPSAGPSGIGALHQGIGNLIGELHSPALGDLQHGPNALHKVQADHGAGHLGLGGIVAGEAAAAEVIEAGFAPYGSVGHLLDILVGNLPPSLHGGVAVLIGALAAGIQVATPSLSTPCKIIASKILTIGGHINACAKPLMHQTISIK